MSQDLHKKAAIPFVIFTPERTGSTTLTRLMNCHPEIRCAYEPFNPGYNGPAPFLCQTLLRTQGIAEAAASLWNYGGYNGFKHVWHTDGWPFKEEPGLNDWLLTESTAGVIVLRRRNLLRRAISGQISTQMNLWVPRNDADRQRIRDHQFAALDVGRLRAEMEGEKAEQERARGLLAGSGKPWCEVFYEDFFEVDLSSEARWEALRKVFAFLGVAETVEAERMRRMEWLFVPANTGFQNARAYERIPNIEEVERELGNAEDGFVFGKEGSEGSEPRTLCIKRQKS